MWNSVLESGNSNYFRSFQIFYYLFQHKLFLKGNFWILDGVKNLLDDAKDHAENYVKCIADSGVLQDKTQQAAIYGTVQNIKRFFFFCSTRCIAFLLVNLLEYSQS